MEEKIKKRKVEKASLLIPQINAKERKNVTSKGCPKLKNNSSLSFLHRFIGTVNMFCSKNRELLVILIISIVWFLSNITTLRSKEVRYQEFGPLFATSLEPDYPDGGLSFLHPVNRSMQDHVLMLYAPWDAESYQARQVFAALAALNPQMVFRAIACWNVSSDCWQKFRPSRFPTFALLITGVNEVIYSGPTELFHLQKFISEAPLGYQTVANDEQLLRVTQLYDNVILGCFNLSLGPVVPGLHQFYAASVQAYDLFAPVPFLVPTYTLSEHFRCLHNGQIVLLRSGGVALTPDVPRPLRSSELQSWLRRNQQPPALAVLNSPGVKSRRLADLAATPQPLTDHSKPQQQQQQQQQTSHRPLLIVFDPVPHHWESPALAWLRLLDAVYSRGCAGSSQEGGSADAVDEAHDAALAAARARAFAEQRRLAEAASLRQICSELLLETQRSTAAASTALGCRRCSCSKDSGGRGSFDWSAAWQRLYGQRPVSADLVSGRLHRLCLLVPPLSLEPPTPSSFSSPHQIFPSAVSHSLRRFGCSGSNTTSSSASPVGMVMVSSRWQPQLMRGMLGSLADVASPAAVIADLAEGSVHVMKGRLTLPALTRFLLRHHMPGLDIDPSSHHPNPNGSRHHRKPHLRRQARVRAPRFGLPTELTGGSLADFAMNSSRDSLVLFHSPACVYCRPVSALVNRLATHLGNQGLAIATVDVSVNDLEPKWAPHKVPALLLFPRDAKLEPVSYVGPAALPSFLSWLVRHASEPLGLRALAGFVQPSAAPRQLELHASGLQKRLNRALEVSDFGLQRLAESMWTLARLTAAEWLLTSHCAALKRHEELRKQLCVPQLLQIGETREQLNRRVGMFRGLRLRCQQLVAELASKRARTLRLLERMSSSDHHQQQGNWDNWDEAISSEEDAHPKTELWE